MKDLSYFHITSLPRQHHDLFVEFMGAILTYDVQGHFGGFLR